jgi:sugar lactone lactonase YvrE
MAAETGARQNADHWEEAAMMKLLGAVAASAFLLSIYNVGPALAWDRGKVETFAVLPDYAPGVPENAEGLDVGLDGNIYVPSGGFNADGFVPGPAKLWVFNPEGDLIRTVTLTGTQPPVLGIAFNPVNGLGFIADLGNGSVFTWNSATNTTTLAQSLPALPLNTPGPNAICFDTAGNAYISDSFQGIIWKTDKNGNNLTQWVPPNTLLTPGTGLNPPFGANGIEFNNEHTAMFVANTANHTLIKIPVNGDGSAGTPERFITGINAPDGIVIDKHDNIWVDANQEDEIVVVDPTGKVIAKLGDFNGISDNGTPLGLLFPASPAFSKDGKFIYTSNFALFLPFAGAQAAIDSAWTLEAKHFTISRLRAEIPPVGDGDHDGDDEHDSDR